MNLGPDLLKKAIFFRKRGIRESIFWPFVNLAVKFNVFKTLRLGRKGGNSEKEPAFNGCYLSTHRFPFHKPSFVLAQCLGRRQRVGACMAAEQGSCIW